MSWNAETKRWADIASTPTDATATGTTGSGTSTNSGSRRVQIADSANVAAGYDEANNRRAIERTVHTLMAQFQALP